MIAINSILAVLEPLKNFDFRDFLGLTVEYIREDSELNFRIETIAGILFITISDNICTVNGSDAGFLSSNVKMQFSVSKLLMMIVDFTKYQYISDGQKIALTNIPKNVNDQFVLFEDFFDNKHQFLQDVFLSSGALVDIDILNPLYLNFIYNFQNKNFEIITNQQKIVLESGFDYSVQNVIFDKKLKINNEVFLFTSGYSGSFFDPKISFYSDDNKDFHVFDRDFVAKYSLDNVKV